MGITLIILFLVLLVSYIIALRKTQRGEMVVFVNKYDFALMFSSYLFLVLMFFSETPSYQWLFLSVSVATFITSLVWSVLANNKDVKLGTLAVLAKLFLMSIVLAILLIYALIRQGRQTKKRVRGGDGKIYERDLTVYEQMREDEAYEKRKQRAFAFVSLLLLSLVVGTGAYKKVLEKNNKKEEEIEKIIQKIEWKNLLYLFSSIVILVLSVGYFLKFPIVVKPVNQIETSVSNSHSTQNDGVASVENQQQAPTETTKKNDEKQKKASESVNANFESFLKKFNSDNVFQKSRVVFPLKHLINAYDEITQNTISKNDYKTISFEENTSMYSIVKEIEENKAKVILVGNENGIYEQFFFEKRNGDWFLVSIESASD